MHQAPASASMHQQLCQLAPSLALQHEAKGRGLLLLAPFWPLQPAPAKETDTHRHTQEPRPEETDTEIDTETDTEEPHTETDIEEPGTETGQRQRQRQRSRPRTMTVRRGDEGCQGGGVEERGGRSFI
eukprot:961433-Rhodomonas_salina.1